MPKRVVAAAQMAAAFAVLIGVNAYVFLWRKRTSLPELHRANDDRHGALPSAAIAPDANGARGKVKNAAPPSTQGARDWLVLPLAGSTLGERLADTTLPSTGLPATLLDSVEYARATAYVGLLADGQPVAIDLQQPSGHTEYWRRTNKTWSALAEDRPLKVKQVALQGATSPSLTEALLRLPAHETLAPLVARLLGGDVDFDLDEQQSGDGKHRVRVLIDRWEVGGQLYRHGHVTALEWQSDRRGTLRAVEYPADSGRYYSERGDSATRRWLRSPFEATLGAKRKVERVPGGEWRAAAGTPVWAMTEGRVVFLTKTSKGAQVTIARDDAQITVRGAFRPVASLRVGAMLSRGQRLGELVGSKEPGATSSLYVELQIAGKRVEGTELPPRGAPCPAADRPQLGEQLARALKELQSAESRLAQR